MQKFHPSGSMVCGCTSLNTFLLRYAPRDVGGRGGVEEKVHGACVTGTKAAPRLPRKNKIEPSHKRIKKQNISRAGTRYTTLKLSLLACLGACVLACSLVDLISVCCPPAFSHSLATDHHLLNVRAAACTAALGRDRGWKKWKPIQESPPSPKGYNEAHLCFFFFQIFPSVGLG